VKSSPYAAFETACEIQNMAIFKEIKKAPAQKIETWPELPFGYLTLHTKNKDEHYMISYALNLFDLESGIKRRLPQKTKDQLLGYIQWLEQHHYGKDVSWKEASQLFPRMGFAEVVDIETGKKFNVQRRAGSQHADVQPLTAEDTKTMKEIYKGKWSWKRRAILVRSGEHILAGSMHGMPHGAGAISNNQFPGHFCIHFKDSTTHRKRYPDPAHDLMISKASGNLLECMIQGTPEELITLFLTAISEQDESVVKLMISQADLTQVQTFMQSLDDIEGVRLTHDPTVNEKITPFTREVQVQLKLKKVGRKEEDLLTRFVLTRGALTGRWKVEIGPLLTQWN